MKYARPSGVRVRLATVAMAIWLGGAMTAVHASKADTQGVAPSPGWTQPYANLTEHSLRSVLQTFADDHALQLLIAKDFRFSVDHAPAISTLRADSAPLFLQRKR